jgi:hypothetical protein
MNTYESVYGVSLLDDLHNYFPALLYDQGRFADIHSIFHYVRSQMNSRFNLYSYGASMFRAANPSVMRERERPFTPAPSAPHTPPVVVRSSVDTDSLATTAFLLSMLGASPLTTPTLGTRVLNAGARAFFPGFTDPVLVRPTRQQIDLSTQLVSNITNQSCAVCQDVLVETDICRRIRHCGHTYHRGCIDQWFERNVRCPVCRYDIRDYATEEDSE